VVGVPQAANQSIEQVRGDLLITCGTVGNIRDRLVELTRLAERLVAQRQSAVEGYEAGYEARYMDLVAQLSGSEYAALRQALADLADHEAIDGGKVLPGFKLRLKAIFPSTETDSPSALRSEGDGG